MIVMPVNPNSVYISMIPKGCCLSGFDSTYPVQLNGIINPDEFQQSIETINRSISTRKFMFVFLIIFIVCILAGMGLFIGGGLSAVSSGKTGFPALIGVGMGIFVLGMIILIVGACILQARVSKRMRESVAAESAKYSARSPTPCSWRLDVTRSVAGYGRNRRSILIYHLIIDIGRQLAPNGGNLPYQNNSYYSQQYGAPQQNIQYAPPPPYSAEPSTGFCARCGTPRVNPTMKFCAGCGQAFPF
ncbi:hypothetical protein I4U23_023482 [Adineta vaga]|nr:hypothetical protein I4U23_023482 [Adineta vaga]